MPALESLPGKIGPYRVVEKIGEGGMGVVYLARDAERRQVALKVLGPAVAGEPSARARLAREVETMRRVRSPYVAEVLDADVTGPSPYIATQYVVGHTLDAAVKRDGPLRGAALQRLAYGLAEALSAIHAAGVVHRDLKPGNVMLQSDGNPVVIDFGIANVADGARLTQTGIVMGTPGYLAPEVIEGEASSAASDIHSWGATVAFAATGRQPFGAGTFQSIFFRVLNGQVELGGVPGTVMPLLTASLTRSPRNRPSARWLASQCVALDPGAMAAMPGLPGHGLPGPGLPGPGGTLVGVPDGFHALGDAPTVPPRPPAGSAAAASSQAATRVADFLPPAGYARPGNGAPPASGAPVDEAWADKLRAYRARDDAEAALARGPGSAQAPGQARPGGAPGGRPEKARPAGGHGLVVLAIAVAGVALAIALPVAGTLLALAVITLLRAADKADSALSARRSAYGARASDIVVVIVTAPWKVATSVLTTAALIPLALVVAAMAAGASVIVGHTTSLPDAGSWAAGAGVAWTIVGPGSRGPRRQLRRITGGMIRTQASMVVGVVAAWCLALATVSSALAQEPYLWPGTSWILPHLPSLGSALHSVQQWLLKNAVSALHLP